MARVAALYDVHANMPALEAVLAEVDAESVDAIVVGGDAAWGPMPVETIERLSRLGSGARFVMGNTDREMVEAFDGEHEEAGADELSALVTAWAAGRLERRHRDFLAGFSPVVTLDVDDMGPVLFCHGSPRSDTEIITSLTPEPRLEPMLAEVEAEVMVCGHTHHQFELQAAGKRVLNAGSVGLPYEGDAAAFWLLLGPGVEFKRRTYDVAGAIEAFRGAGCPQVDELFEESLLQPVDPRSVAEHFERQALARP